jgi:hypothetical protein
VPSCRIGVAGEGPERRGADRHPRGSSRPERRSVGDHGPVGLPGALPTDGIVFLGAREDRLGFDPGAEAAMRRTASLSW